MRKFVIFSAKLASIKVGQLKPKVEQQPPKNKTIFKKMFTWRSF